jgi:hypothetical protein
MDVGAPCGLTTDEMDLFAPGVGVFIEVLDLNQEAVGLW